MDAKERYSDNKNNVPIGIVAEEFKKHTSNELFITRTVKKDDAINKHNQYKMDMDLSIVIYTETKTIFVATMAVFDSVFQKHLKDCLCAITFIKYMKNICFPFGLISYILYFV